MLNYPFAQFSSTDVSKLQAQLKEIDAQRVDGKFVTASGEVPAGNEEVCDLLRRCLIWSEMVLSRSVVKATYFHLTVLKLEQKR